MSVARIAAANELEEDRHMERQLKVGIVAGLISSLVVVIFIQPILNFLWRLILNVGGTLHQGYVDRIYRNAAWAGGNPYGEPTLFVVVTVFMMVVLFWTVESIKTDPAVHHFHRLTTLMELIVLLTVLMSFLVVAGRMAIFQGTADIAESFTQRLTVLAPAISDSEYKTLKARWAGMRGKADYDAIVADMDKRAAELGVNLPSVRKR